jgi:hypothetical protein
MAVYRQGRIIMADKSEKFEWHNVADLDELPEGRVKTVTAGVHSMVLSS